MADGEKTPKKKTREEIEAEVREKVSCEERAFRWVEHLATVDKITKEELKTMMNEIMPNHYEDIVEERACSKVCGYPLCASPLKKRSQQKYHISMKHNKVIDLAVRENFCSLYCYRASKYLEGQVPGHPIWLRKNSKPTEIALLEKEKQTAVVTDVGEIAISLSNIDITEIENPKGEKRHKKKKRRDSYFGESSSSDENSGSDTEEDVKDIRDASEMYDQRQEVTSDQRASTDRGSEKRTKLVDQKDIAKTETGAAEISKCLKKIKDTLTEWLTIESYHHLRNLQRGNRDSDDDTDDDDDSCFPPADDFHAQVSNFLSRQPEWLSESCLQPENKESESKKDTIKRKVVLPSVDSRSQASIRRRIVHEKLASCLRDVLPLCGLLDEDLTQVSFFKFVDMFNFTSKNIVFNSKQWMATTIVLILVISRLSKGNFAGVKRRLKDMDDFLKMRSLPSISQMGEILKEILQRVADVSEVRAEHCTVKKTCDETNEDDTTKFYYDRMEEVD